MLHERLNIPSSWQVRRARVKSKPRSPVVRSVSASTASLCAAAEQAGRAPDGPRRALSEGRQSPEAEPEPALPPAAGRLIKKKQSKLSRRAGAERGRQALQQVKKRKKMKEKA